MWQTTDGGWSSNSWETQRHGPMAVASVFGLQLNPTYETGLTLVAS
jgi:hypothetical protein